MAEGFLEGFTQQLAGQKEQVHRDEMKHLDLKMGNLLRLYNNPDVQNDPEALNDVMTQLDDTASGRSWQREQKERQKQQGANQGPLSNLEPKHHLMLGHVLHTLHKAAGTAFAPGPGFKERQVTPINMGAPGVESKVSDEWGNRLPDAPGIGIARAFKTPEQRQQAEQASKASDAEAERQEKIKDLQLAGVDQKSPEGQNYLLGGRTAAHATGTEVDDTVVNLRKKRADDLKLTGDARTEYILTGKMPTGFGTTPKTAKENTTDIALDAKADELGVPKEKLTGAQKVAAVRDFRAATKTGKAPSPGKGAAMAVGASKSKGYVPGGASVANPGQKDQYVEMAAWEWLLNDKLPFTGMGMGGQKGAPNKRELAVARAGELLQDLGISPQELPGIRDRLKANAGALQQMTKMGSMLGQFEETAQLNMGLAKTLSDRYARTASPLVNQLVGGIMQKSGNADVNNFLIQMRTLATEYAKIMSGATSVTGARVGDTEEATKFINGFLGKGQMEGLFQVMQQDIANRQKSVDDSKAGLLQKIRQPMAGFGNQVGAQTQSGATTNLPKPSQKGQLISKAQAAQYIAAYGGPAHAKEAIDAAVKDNWRVK